MDDQLRVAVGAEHVALGLELDAPFGIIEQLAVADDGHATILVEDRLLAVLQPEDAQPTVRKPDSRHEQKAGNRPGRDEPGHPPCGARGPDRALAGPRGQSLLPSRTYRPAEIRYGCEASSALAIAQAMRREGASPPRLNQCVQAHLMDGRIHDKSRCDLTPTFETVPEAWWDKASISCDRGGRFWCLTPASDRVIAADGHGTGEE